MKWNGLITAFFVASLLAICPLHSAEPGNAAGASVESGVDSGGGKKDSHGNHDDHGSGHDDHGDGHGDDHGGDHGDDHGGGHGGHSSRLAAGPLPMQPQLVPPRPRLLLELGTPFLGQGRINKGFRLFTGAVWQPSLWVFGTLRAGVNSSGYDTFSELSAFGGRTTPDARTTEAAVRLDIFANLYLTGSERLVLGFRPADSGGAFTGHVFDTEVAGRDAGGVDGLNGEVAALFFEGDFGEIFPLLANQDFSATDFGFSIGRQRIFYQEGTIINDEIDAIGVTRNTLLPKNSSNFRITGLYAWNRVNRANNPDDQSGGLWAIFTSVDFRPTTFDFDVAFSKGAGGDDDQLVFGLSAIQRFGLTNTTFRLLGSSINDDRDDTEGFLAFAEFSWFPFGSHDHIYFQPYIAVNEFQSISRGPEDSGPLQRIGISFEGVGLGTYGSAANSEARDVMGGAFGYQFFFDHTAKQLILEVATRYGLATDVANQAVFNARYQAKFGQHTVMVLDAFVNGTEGVPIRQTGIEFDDELIVGGRFEIQVFF